MIYKTITRVSVAVAATATLSTVGIAGASASGAAPHGPQAARLPAAQISSHAAAVPGAQLWVQRYNGPGNGFDAAASVAVSPGGGTVFVTGSSTGAYATVAYSAVTGARLWASRYKGPGGSTAASVAVSPDGRKVFVTGTSEGATTGDDYATVAYDAATGAQLWAKRYNGPGNGLDRAASVAVSPRGTAVFVTGSSAGATSRGDYATVAYSAATGTQLWASRYNGPANRDDVAASVVASRTGGRVFVTGTSEGTATGADYATIAYSAATGAQLWARRYDGPIHSFDTARAVAVSPTGGTVFVTGTVTAASGGGAPAADYGTVAYNAATGGQLWARLYNGSSRLITPEDRAFAVAVSPAGGRVFVTGESLGGSATGYDYATVAYTTSTGSRLWASRYNGPKNGPDSARALAVSRGGQKVFVTGSSGGTSPYADYATVAYNTATGARLWAQRYNGPVNRDDIAYSVAASRAGNVFVTGQSVGSIRPGYFPGFDYATIAYSG
jgi:outer membrane protein assembly factor BamB